MKGLVLLLCYFIIAICFFVDKLPQSELVFKCICMLLLGKTIIEAYNTHISNGNASSNKVKTG